ncbi:MAG: electron transport complex subunit RsxC [Lachnospirales bacterium]
MSLHTFKRGIHPPDGKAYSNTKPIEIIMPKEGALMVFPLSQHIGAPAEAIVKKGDRVLVGQKIAEANAFVCSPIHSSVSGTVKDIKPMLAPSGMMIPSIIIENDGLMEEDPNMGKDTDWQSFSKEKILEKVKNAGIVGLGGAGFPTHVKLNPPPTDKIDTIIVNAAECEPYLTTDHRIMLEKTDRLVLGLSIMLKLHESAKGYIAIEANKPDAIEKVGKACESYPDISVLVLKTKYPQGSEKQLIYAVTGREVDSGKLPASAGCIVDNVDTVLAIERAVVEDKPLMRRIVTFTGDAVKNPGNYQVRIGMNINEFIEAVGGFKEEPGKIIAGGPMMGPAMFNTDAPFVKTSSALLCLTRESATLPPEENCIRCGKCVSACPMGLMPLVLAQNARAREFEAFEAHDGLDCIECGSCSYVCPSKRHLAQSLRVFKREVMASKRKK